MAYNLKEQMSKPERFEAGHRLCAGCGAGITCRAMMRAVDPEDKAVICNATSCPVSYTHLPETPVSNPALAEQYPLILTTGGRQQPYFVSNNRQIKSLRKMEPFPLVRIHPDTCLLYTSGFTITETDACPVVPFILCCHDRRIGACLRNLVIAISKIQDLDCTDAGSGDSKDAITEGLCHWVRIANLYHDAFVVVRVHTCSIFGQLREDVYKRQVSRRAHNLSDRQRMTASLLRGSRVRFKGHIWQ